MLHAMVKADSWVFTPRRTQIAPDDLVMRLNQLHFHF